MENNHEEAANVMAFDALYTTNQIQKLKVLLPYIEPPMQKNMAVYIKYMELQYTMRYVRKHPFQISGCSISNDQKPDLQSLCLQLSLYSSPEEIKQLEQFRSMIQTMETMQEMSQTFSALQEIFPDMSTATPFEATDSSEGKNAFSMMDMLMNMLTPEQKEMFEMFQQQSSEPPIG